MFDNFGLSEFLFLAVLALLFFGPERLPQIGARVGRWVSSMTQYSKAFMNQWREEALVIQDAMDEVRGIRDEIRAARAEIASSLETARDGVTEGLEVAQEAFGDARAGVTNRIAQARQGVALGSEASAQAAAKTPGARNTRDDVAIAKTQEIVDALMEKRAASAEKVPAQETTEEDEHARNVQAIQEIQERDAARARVREAQAETKRTAEIEPASASPSETDLPEAETEPEERIESAYDKTQRVLDELRQKRAAAAEKDKAFTAQPADQSTAVAEEEPAPVSSRLGGQEQPVAAKPLEGWVSYTRFTKLSLEVDVLKNEIQTLRDELNVLRADAFSSSTSLVSGQTQQISAEPNSKAVSVEEAA
jgi:Sec-independent protein translocase protein TatA